MLQIAVRKRHDDWHTPTVGYVGAAGTVCQRSVVLRRVETDPLRLAFHTHVLSGKVAALRADPRVSLHFYHRHAKVQAVCTGTATLHTDDAEADAAWSRTALFSRRCYMVAGASGMPLDSPGSGYDLYDVPHDRTPDLEESERGRAYFAIVRVQIRHVDWLYLAMNGNRRALIDVDAGAVNARWVLP